MPTIASAKARKRRSAITARQSPSRPVLGGGTVRVGSASAWAAVSSAKIPAAVSATARKSARRSTVPRSGPSSDPVVAKTLNRANASALRAPASCAR